MKTEELEAIIFDEIGSYPYRLKKLDKPHPLMNGYGLIYINGDYYKKQAVRWKDLEYSKAWHPAH